MSTANSAASQPYIQQLRDSSYLFDQLSETQAEQLLAWAAKQLAAAPEAELDETTGALSRLLRQVNGLSPMLAYLIEDELAEDLALAFVGSVARGASTEDAPLGSALLSTCVDPPSSASASRCSRSDTTM